ncbi:gibberellin-regulated protein 9 [Syzygium oleosum]|uniref:gibberellin-regulated protein 9 n=1 Tax=Syzygium oleosum TaxID=219896 RepID=UPI0024BAAA32|nr:gibberellin-regulated protein 9 [Syzygium oleosum]
MKMKLFLLFVTAILLIQAFAEASQGTDASHALASMNGGERGITNIDKRHQHHPRKINCSYVCARRCSKSSRKNMCHRACKTCCARCHCVPPGTYGNKNACPCYAKLKTHGNRPKCP